MLQMQPILISSTSVALNQYRRFLFLQFLNYMREYGGDMNFYVS